MHNEWSRAPASAEKGAVFARSRSFRRRLREHGRVSGLGGVAPDAGPMDPCHGTPRAPRIPPHALTAVVILMEVASDKSVNYQLTSLLTSSPNWTNCNYQLRFLY